MSNITLCRTWKNAVLNEHGVFLKQIKSSEALRRKAGKKFQKPNTKKRHPETVGLTNETWIQWNREKERDFS